MIALLHMIANNWTWIVGFGLILYLAIGGK